MSCRGAGFAAYLSAAAAQCISALLSERTVGRMLPVVGVKLVSVVLAPLVKFLGPAVQGLDQADRPLASVAVCLGGRQ